MNKTHAKRRRDIKTKLMAAICMLMVSSIMMVSTTYAWFTLSTAPEVTGINTAVGANGNLEIALLPKDGQTSSITSSTGDSMLPIAEKNVTWGNLVDLSDSSVYGLDSITLYPAALNIASYDETTGYLATIGEILLQTPSYGSDGRVATLNPNTSNGYYNATEKNFYPNEDMGVRAVGTASGMTDRQLAYRNARSAANTAAAQAKSVASNSLNNNGSTLANIAIKYGTSGEEATFDMDDINAMQTIVNDLLGTDTKTGSLEYIETAYLQYILAYSASAAVNDVGAAAEAWGTVEGLVEAENATAQNVLAELKGLVPEGATLPESLATAIAAFEKTKTDVNSAQGELTDLKNAAKDSYTWTEIREVLTKLANPTSMEVNGIKASEIKQGENMSNLVNSVASGGLKVTMKTGGGVYADIADQCGDFTASVVIEAVTYNGLTLKNMTARMETASTQSTAYLTGIGTVVGNAGAPASGNTDNQPITDMFGYVIDLAFRTNAAESNLLLQREAVDRIYGDNANEGTMGHGSNMTFQTVSSELSEAQIRELMGAIRLVFFTHDIETDANNVILCAKLDATNAAKNTNDAWVANLLLYKQKSGTTTTTYEPVVYDAENPGENVTYYTKAEGSEDYTAVTDTLVDGNTYYVQKTTTSSVPAEEAVSDNVIMALPQNTAVQLSVLVYLDGNLVGNEDVAAAAATSLVGQLNLQFASSATLVPMDYSQLHTPNTQATTTYNVTVPTGVTGDATATAGADYTFTVDTANYTLGTVTVGGTAVTPTGGENGVYTIPAASVTGAIVINVTANAG